MEKLHKEMTDLCREMSFLWQRKNFLCGGEKFSLPQRKVFSAAEKSFLCGREIMVQNRLQMVEVKQEQLLQMFFKNKYNFWGAYKNFR